MKSYIGTKVIQAEPQNNPNAKFANIPELGYKVKYEDGYESWSPAATFERNYRLISNAEKALIFTED